MPVQKQTRAGQRTRFKAFVAIGDYDGHIGLGVKCSKEVATAIRGAIILAKLSVIPVRLVQVSVLIFDSNSIGGGGGCNPKKPNSYPRKGNTGIGFFWVFLGF